MLACDAILEFEWIGAESKVVQVYVFVRYTKNNGLCMSYCYVWQRPLLYVKCVGYASDCLEKRDRYKWRKEEGHQEESRSEENR